MIAGLVSIHYGYKGPNLAHGQRLLDRQSQPRRGGAAHRVRRRRHHDGGRLRGDGLAARHRRVLRRRARCPRATTTPPPRAGPGTSAATASCSARAPGVLVLEELEHAKARGARDLLRARRLRHERRRAPHHRAAGGWRRGAARSMLNALQATPACTPTDIDYINAHGTSTPLGDLAECVARQARVRRPRAESSRSSSTKSMTGHLLGAAGGIEAVFTVLAMRDQVAPPTANLVDVDPAVRPRFRAAGGAQDEDPRGAVQFVRLRRHQRHAGVPRAYMRCAGRQPARPAHSSAMALIVQKYGGTSVGSTDRIKSVARRVAHYHRARAPGGRRGLRDVRRDQPAARPSRRRSRRNPIRASST